GETAGACDIGEGSGGGRGDNRKCAVVGSDTDSRDGDGLSGGQTVRGGGSDSDEEAVFGGARWTGRDGNGGRLRGAVGAGGDGHDGVFVDDGRRSAGPALADAIEVRIIELAREIVADFAVADGE